MTNFRLGWWTALLGSAVLLLWSLIDAPGKPMSAPPTAAARANSEPHTPTIDLRSRTKNPPTPQRRAQARQAHEAARAPAPLRFSDLERDAESQRLAHRAGELAIARCMAARGFTYRFDDYDADQEAGLAYDRRDPEDLDAARAIGYGLALGLDRGSEPPVHDPNREGLDAMTGEQRNAFSEALLGSTRSIHQHKQGLVEDPNYGVVSSGGATVVWDRRSCISEGQRALYGDDLDEQKLRLALSEVQNRLVRDVFASADVRQGLSRWQDCMRAHGHPYDGPEIAGDDLAKRYHAKDLTLDELRAAEIEVASADVRCQRETGLVAVRKSVRSEAERAAELKHQDLLARYASLIESSREAALRILSTERPPAADRR